MALLGLLLLLPATCSGASLSLNRHPQLADRGIGLRRLRLASVLRKHDATGSDQLSAYVSNRCEAACGNGGNCSSECQNEMYGCLDHQALGSSPVSQEKCMEAVEAKKQQQQVQAGGDSHLISRRSAGEMAAPQEINFASTFTCSQRCLIDMYLCADNAPEQAQYHWTQAGVALMRFGELIGALGNPATGDEVTESHFDVAEEYHFTLKRLVERGLILQESAGHDVRKCMEDVKGKYAAKAYR